MPLNLHKGLAFQVLEHLIPVAIRAADHFLRLRAGYVHVRTTGLDQSQAICNLYIIVLLGLGVRGMGHLNTVKSFGFQGSDILFVEGETTPVSWPG